MSDAPAAGRAGRTLGFRILVTVFLFALLWRSVDWPSLTGIVSRLSVGVFVACVLLCLLGVVISSLKLQLLLRMLSIDSATFRIIQSYLIGIFWSNFLPSTVGGDAVKFLILQRPGESRTDLAAAIIIERYLGGLALLFISLGTIYMAAAESLSPIIAILTVFGLVVSLLLFSANAVRMLHRVVAGTSKWQLKIAGVISKFADAVAIVRGSPLPLGCALLYSIIFALLSGAMSYLLLLDLGHDIGFWRVTIITALVHLATMLPISMNGLGIREWSFVLLLGLYAVPPTTAIVLSLAAYAVVLVVSAIGGIAQLTLRRQE